MDRRKTAKHSRDPLPVGTIRIRSDKGRKNQLIKVCNSGPKGRRWMAYSRWLWLKHRGPIEPGKIVLHIDGDTLNDALDNLALGTVGDNAFLWHHRDPDGSRRNYEKAGQATAEQNRLRATIRRHLEWLLTLWYPVDHARREIINDPCRTRWQCYRFANPTVGVLLADSAALGWPSFQWEWACVLTVLVDADTDLLVGEVLGNYIVDASSQGEK